MSTTKRLIAGAMSGTSADGVDVAIVEVEGRGLAMTAKPLSHAYHAFSPELRKQILEVRQRGDVRLADLAEIGRQVTLAHVPAFGAACLQANVSSNDIAAIAAHGQTLFHGPPNTIQYFDPSLLAFETGCAVVNDFRRADLAAGGQGAPLVPFADWMLFRHSTKSRVILNIGGIANLTYLKAGGAIDEVIAFDTGPGNCISDWLIAQDSKSTVAYDEGGQLASKGHADSKIVHEFLHDDFVSAAPPKSTDGPAMIAAFRRTAQDFSSAENALLENQLATAAEIVASCVTHSVFHGFPDRYLLPDELFIAGGGAKNAAVVAALERQFSDSYWGAGGGPREALAKLDGGTVVVRDLDVLGIAADAREAIAFALLGAATLDGEPSNVPSATGASRRVVLGSITPKP